MTIQEFYATREWCQFAYAQDVDYNHISLYAPEAYAYCFDAAIELCYPSVFEAHSLREKVEEKVEEFSENWNDSPACTKAKVVALATSLGF